VILFLHKSALLFNVVDNSIYNKLGFLVAIISLIFHTKYVALISEWKGNCDWDIVLFKNSVKPF